MQVTSILIGGVEMISVCRKEATEINVESNGKMSTARLEAVFDTTATSASDSSKVGTAVVGTAVVGTATLGLTLGVQQAVTIMGGATYLFTGFVARLSPQVVSPNLIRYAIDCQDNTRLLDRAMVASATYTSWSDEAILDDLFATYLPAITTTGVIGTSPETVLDSITFENLSLRACVDRICERTGAEWRLGFDSDLKYYAVGSNDGAFDFSDSADGSATEYVLQSDFGYQEEFSQPANAVSVVGYKAPKPDQASIVLPVGAAADDGFVYAYSSIHWPPTDNLTADTAGAAFFLYSSFSGGIYQFSNAFIRFDTSAIPAGATIVSAVLKLYGVATSGIYDRAVGADYFDSSNWPIGVGDYSADPATLTGYEPSAIDWRDLAPFNLGGFGSVPTLLELALKGVANIPVSGYVGLRIFAGKSGAFMTDSFQVQIDSVSSATVRYRPTLTITYQEPQPAPIAGYAEDAASITLYGTFSKIIADNGITTEGEADARAAVETVRYGCPRKSINCTYDRDGLNVGDTVHFVSSLLGIDDEFIVKRLRLRWPRTQDGTRYCAELGEARADLIEILRKG